jgi:predicted Zn-dependent protease
MDAVPPADRASLERLGYVGTPAVGRPSGGAPSEPASVVVDPTIVEQYRSAVRLLSARQLNDAIEAFHALAIRQATSPDSWMHVAAVATLAEKHEVAADAYRHIVELTPASPEGHLGVARALLSLRRFDDARTQAMQIVDESIGDAASAGTAHELLARAALGRRNYEAARAEAAKAEAANPKRPVVAYVNGRIAVDQRKWPDALDAFESALAALRATQEPPLADLRLYAAEALTRAERLSEAEYLFLEELKDAPFNSRAVAGLTAVYKATSRNDEAKALSQH